jgi:hypothetical protein
MKQVSRALDKLDLLDRAEDALRTCEAEMQILVADAASSSMYDEIDRLTAIARSLNEMALSSASAQRLDRLADVGASSLTVARKPSPSRTRRPAAKADYPKFARDGENLVKTGWSKKRREEYVHRAHSNQAESVVLFLAGHGRANGTIPIDDILGVRDRRGAEMPSYQVYLTLAWLRKEGLVERRGRNGYAVLDAQELEGTFADLWSALPEYRTS